MTSSLCRRGRRRLPPPLLVHLLSTSPCCLYLSASLTVTLSAASGMQSGSEEGRGEGQKRDKYVILVYGFGMTQHSPLFLVQQRKCEAPPIRTLLMVNTLRRWRRRRIHNRPPSRQANITSR